MNKILRTNKKATVNVVGKVTGTRMSYIDCVIDKMTFLKNDGGVLTYYRYIDDEGNTLVEGESLSTPDQVAGLYAMVKPGVAKPVNIIDFIQNIFFEGTKILMVQTFSALNSVTDIDIIDLDAQ